MRLNSLSMINFRNYMNNHFALDNNHVILLGKNGIGKTNFLEAIYYLSTSRSFKSSKDESLISIGNDFFNITGQINEKEIAHRINITYTVKKEKNIIFDNHPCKAKDLISRMNTVVFHNDDLEIIRGVSSVRRRYIDTVLSQTDSEYYHCLVVYNHLIRQKKEILKKKAYLLSSY